MCSDTLTAVLTSNPRQRQYLHCSVGQFLVPRIQVREYCRFIWTGQPFNYVFRLSRTFPKQCRHILESRLHTPAPSRQNGLTRLRMYSSTTILRLHFCSVVLVWFLFFHFARNTHFRWRNQIRVHKPRPQHSRLLNQRRSRTTTIYFCGNEHYVESIKRSLLDSVVL